MFRLGLILIVTGLLLADPILCRTARVASPCAGMSQEPRQSPIPDESSPHDPCQDTGHGCLCQGATVIAYTDVPKAPLDDGAVVPEMAPVPGRLSAFSHQFPPSPARHRATATGRAVRIACQSFLI